MKVEKSWRSKLKYIANSRSHLFLNIGVPKESFRHCIILMKIKPTFSEIYIYEYIYIWVSRLDYQNIKKALAGLGHISNRVIISSRYKSKHKHLNPHKKGFLQQYDIKNRIAYSRDFQKRQNFRPTFSEILLRNSDFVRL